MSKEFKNPDLWVYVIEKEKNKVKIGVSKNYKERIQHLERTGGFYSLRHEILGPFHNGYEVECKIFNQLKQFRINGEWFEISYEDAVSVAKNVANEVGKSDPIQTTNTTDCSELIDFLFPIKAKISLNQDPSSYILITGFVDENDTLWFETDEWGIFLPEFLTALLRTGEFAEGGKNSEDK